MKKIIYANFQILLLIGATSLVSKASIVDCTNAFETKRDSIRENGLPMTYKLKKKSVDNTLTLAMNFNAIRSQNKVIISWSPSSINCTERYILERSKDGKRFKKVVTIEGSDASENKIDFHETDSEPCTGISYYRLQQITCDKKVYYSNNVMVNYSFENTDNSFYPNPEKEQNFKMCFKNKLVLLIVKDCDGNEFYSKFFVTTDNTKITGEDSEYKLKAGEYTIIGSSENVLYGKIITIL